MKNYVFYANNSAVSEIIGGLIIVFIAIIVSVSIYMQMLPVPIPSLEPNVHFMGYITEDGKVIIEHMGGETISSYEIHVHNLNKTTIHTYENSPWEIGESKTPTNVSLSTENGEIKITVYSIYDDSSRHIVFNGVLEYKETEEETTPLIHPMLISSLRTDTTDEDLICYNYSIIPDINASTYIYKWVINDQPLNEILMPFDTENATITKDYSGNGYNGTVIHATWVEDGKVGGAYYFDGAGDYITLDSPTLFEDLSSNDFTISIWIKSANITDDFRVVLETGNKTKKSYTLIFQCGTEIHFGVCDDGVKRAVRTDNLSNNTWYHIAGVWDASEKSMAIYVNGTISTEVGYRSYAMGIQEGFDIGHGSAS
ncbi:MAG: type IV pilin, partial [Thermoplasmatales archaeon]